MATPIGSFDILLLPAAAPNTVANFLRYQARATNSYNDTFIHRVAPGFVVQGGGLLTSTFVDSGTTLHADHIPTDPPVANEFNLSNVRGTVAMAKMAGNPNSATSEWFVNLADNSGNLDDDNGGFTVFGQVIAGMNTVDNLNILPRIRTSGEGVPVYRYTQPNIATQENLMKVSMVILTGPKADFNGDGKPDLLWQNSSTGERAVWLMNGTTRASSASLGVVPLDWNIMGSGDFDRDGKSDILWQNSRNGQRLIWLMNGTTRTSSVSLGYVPLNWNIAGAGDFNGDGKPDILWESATTAQRSIWLMNGTTLSSAVSLANVPADWRIVGSGDFNADAKSDIVWQNITHGQRSIWLMNGTTRTGAANLQTIPVAWNIAGAGDFNADGDQDLLWQNSSDGSRSMWVMNDATHTSNSNLGQVPVAWSIRNR